MLPSLKAIADRFVYDNATLIAVAALADCSPGPEGRCAATGWTLRQTLGHLAYAQEGYAAALEKVLAGNRVLSPSGRLTQEEQVERYAATGLEAITAELCAGRDRVVAALATISPAQADMTVAVRAGEITASELASRYYASHMREHGIDLLEAMPALVEDAVVLDWALDPAYAAGMPPEWLARRRAVIEAARERLGKKRQRAKKKEGS